MRVSCARWIVTLLGAWVLAACASAPPHVSPGASSSALGDVDIHLPVGLERHPALRNALEAVVARERREFAAAAATTSVADASAWQLTLNYRILVGNARLRVAEGDGYVLTGGAHGAPIIERQVYDVESDRVLRIEDWFDDAEVWAVITARVRASLFTQLDVQDDADAGQWDADERQQDADSRQWVLDGTAPKSATYALYEPLFSPEGPVLFFRFHFPPYRVAAYSEGPQQVDVPVELLLPFVRKEARVLVSALAKSE